MRIFSPFRIAVEITAEQLSAPVNGADTPVHQAIRNALDRRGMPHHIAAITPKEVHLDASVVPRHPLYIARLPEDLASLLALCDLRASGRPAPRGEPLSTTLHFYDPGESGEFVRDQLIMGWELWHIGNSPLTGRWELRYREQSRPVTWDAIIALRSGLLRVWAEQHLEDTEVGPHTWVYRCSQRALFPQP